MRKIAAYAVIFALLITLVSAASVLRSMPSRVSPGEDITVAFSISAEAGKIFTLEDTVPEGWNLKSWEVTGAKETKDKINYRFAEGKKHGWSFTPSSGSATITYVLSIPSNAALQSYSFNAVYFDPSGFSKDDSSATVRIITCGDNVCEGTENSDNCIADCPKPAPTTPVTPPEEEAKAPSGGVNMVGIAIVVLIIAVGIIAYFFFRKKK